MPRSYQPSPYLSTVRTRSGAVVPYMYGRPSSKSPPWSISTTSSQMTDYSSEGGPPDSDWDRATPPPGSLPVPAPSSPSGSAVDSLLDYRIGSPLPILDESDVQPEYYWSFSPPASPVLSAIPPPIQAHPTPDLLRSCCAINHPVHESQLTNEIHPLFLPPSFLLPMYDTPKGLTSPQGPSTPPPLLPTTQSLTACSPFNTTSTPTAVDRMPTLDSGAPFALPDAAVATTPPNIDLTQPSRLPSPLPQQSTPASPPVPPPDLSAFLEANLRPALQLASHLLACPPTMRFLARTLFSPYTTAAIPSSAPEADGLLFWHLSPVESTDPALLASVRAAIDAALPHVRIGFIDPWKMPSPTHFGETATNAAPAININLTARFVTDAFGCPDYAATWSEASKLRACLFFAINLVHEVMHALHHLHRGSVQPRPEGWPVTGREPFLSQERWERLVAAKGHGEGGEVQGELGLAWGMEVLGADLEPVKGVEGLHATEGLLGRKRRWVADEDEDGAMAEAIAEELRRGGDGHDGELDRERKRRKVRQETCYGAVPMGWVESLFEDETWDRIYRGGRWREAMEDGKGEAERRGEWAIDRGEELNVPLGAERFHVGWPGEAEG